MLVRTTVLVSSTVLVVSTTVGGSSVMLVIDSTTLVSTTLVSSRLRRAARRFKYAKLSNLAIEPTALSVRLDGSNQNSFEFTDRAQRPGRAGQA